MSIWRRWVGLLATREVATSLALVRVATGLSMLYAIASVVGADLVGGLWLDAEFGGIRSYRAHPWLIELLGGPTPAVIWSLVGAIFAGSFGLILGVLPRVSALVVLQSHLALTWLNGQAGGSYDDLFGNMLFLLMLADSSATLSLTCRLRTGRWTSRRLVASWPRWLMVSQLVIMYLSTGTHKLSVYWVPGGDLSALYYILQQPSWQRWDMSWVAWAFPLTQLATLSTWFFENGSPLLILAFWYRHTRTRPGRLRALFNRIDFRTLFALFGLGLHLGIMVLMDVGPFSIITLSFYIALYSPDELHRWVGWLAARLPAISASGRRSPAAPSP